MNAGEERLAISALGADVALRPGGVDRGADALSFDVIGRPAGFLTQPHVHTDQVEHFEVLAGEMRVVLGGRSHVLGPGDQMEVPSGTAHRQLPSGSGAGHVRVTVTPAGRTEEFLRHLARLSADGQFNRLGLPRPVAGARLILDFAETGHAAVPPLPLQRLLARLILAVTAGVQRLWREYAFVDEWDVPAPPEAVYEALADTRTYPQWWRPVYIEVTADGPPVVGTVSHQHFKGRLPYHLHTQSRIVRLQPGRLVEAEVDGDLRGRGIWTLTPDGEGTHVRFDWTVYADRRLLQLLTPVLRAALRANHNWAIARAIEGLEPYVREGATVTANGHVPAGAADQVQV